MPSAERDYVRLLLLEVDLRILPNGNQASESNPARSIPSVIQMCFLQAMQYGMSHDQARVRGYTQQGRRTLLRLHEKGDKEKKISCHHILEEYLDSYLRVAGHGASKDAVIFRTAIGRTRRLSGNAMTRFDAWKMVQRRLKDCGIVGEFSNHSFRATGVTTFLETGGTLESAHFIAWHADSHTTKLYDRRKQRAILEDLERARY